MKKLANLILIVAFFGLVSCQKDQMYEDGNYKAEFADFNFSWKEFMEVTISNNTVTAVNYDAVNEDDGSLKSDLTEYGMPDPPGLPSVWFLLLEAQYLAADITNYQGVDGISGATSTSMNAEILFALILDAAKEGDTSTQVATK